MGRLMWLFSVLMILSSLALAEGPLTPSELLIEAQKGRVEYVRAVSDITGNAATLADRETTLGYLLVLDQLAEIEGGYDLGSMGASPIKALGFALTSAATKWMRIDIDPTSEIGLYLRYASNGSRNSMADIQLHQLDRVLDPAEYLLWMERATFCVETTRALGSEIFVVQAFEDLQAAAVKKALLSPLGNQESFIEKVLINSTSLSSLTEIAEFLRRNSVSATSVEVVLRNLKMARIFDRNVKANPSASMTLQGIPGRVIAESLGRLIDLHGAVAKTELQASVDAMDAQSVTSIAGLIIGLSDLLIHKDQVDLLSDLAMILSTKCAELGIGQQQLALETLAAKLAMARTFRDYAFEGSYDVIFSNGKKGIITLLNAGLGLVIAGITTMYGVHDDLEMNYSNFYFKYNEETKRFESFGNPSDSIEFQIRSDINTDLFFRLMPGNCIAGTFGYPTGQPAFSGCRRETYPVFDKAVGTADPSTFTSLWRGICANHVTELRISQVGRRLQGNWKDLPSWSSYALNFGVIDLNAHSAIMTSGETDAGRFAQARVRFVTKDELEVAFILGGRGLHCHEYFRRVTRPGM